MNQQSLQKFWIQTLIQRVKKIIPYSLHDMLIYLIIDDTLTEKYGQHFEDAALLFDHCARNGTNYLNGNCFVSLVLAVPVCINGNVRYVKCLSNIGCGSIRSKEQLFKMKIIN